MVRKSHLNCCSIWKPLVKAKRVVNVMYVTPADTKIALDFGRSECEGISNKIRCSYITYNKQQEKNQKAYVSL